MFVLICLPQSCIYYYMASPVRSVGIAAAAAAAACPENVRKPVELLFHTCIYCSLDGLSANEYKLFRANEAC
jgi:hypothetical protein